MAGPCEYPGCDEEEDTDTYGFMVNGLVEHEVDYCSTHAPASNCIDP